MKVEVQVNKWGKDSENAWSDRVQGEEKDYKL